MKSAGRHAKTSVAAAPLTSPKLQPKTAEASTSRLKPQAQRLLPSLAFFLVYFLCLWRWLGVGLIYHAGGLVKDFPSFYWGWEFAREFRTRPGGLVEYGSAWLAQSLYSSWFGALVLTLQAAVVYASLASLLCGLGAAKKLRFIALIPPLLVLGIYSKYRHYSAPVASFTAGLVCLWAWLQCSANRPRWRLGGALLIEACLYAAAPSALVVFLPVAAFSVIRSSRRSATDLEGTRSGASLDSAAEKGNAVEGAPATLWKLLLWLGLCSLIPPVEGAALFGFAPGEAYAKLLPLALDPLAWRMTAAWLVATLYLLPPLGSLAAVLWEIFRARRCQARPLQQPTSDAKSPVASALKRKESRPAKARKVSWARRLAVWQWETAGVVLLPIATVWLLFSSQTRAFLQVDYLAWNGRWPEILTAAKANPRNPFVACIVAQACFHTGTLTRELPMLPAPAALLLFDEKQQSHWRKSDLYFDLGYLNMALHHLTESVEFYGERPVLLRRLALINLALGNFSTAKVYLGTLARAPFQGRWARQYLERLQNDPTLAGDEEVRRLRRLMIKRDSVVVFSADEELLQLLAANRQNRMAFEYLMTYYLLTKNLNGFAKNISRVNDFAGFEISPLWDEALLLAARQLGHPVDVGDHTISAEARSRVDAVTQLVQPYARSLRLPPADLAADYAHTYSYYWCFEH